MTGMSNPEVFRTKSSTIGAGITLVLILGLNIQTWFSAPLRSSIVTGIWSTCVSGVIYLVIYRPKVTIFDEGVTITNPVKEYTIGWDTVESVEAKYSMSIITHDGSEIFAWAAPAPSRYHSRSIHPSELRGMNVGAEGIIRPGESPRADSGVAKHLVLARLDKFQNSNVVAVANSVRFHFAGITVTGVSFIVGIALHLLKF
jgi:hypothetical protein